MACTLAAAHAGVEGEAEYRCEVIARWQSLGSQSDAEVLGVPENADPGSVKAAYLRLARRFHPDGASAATTDLRGRLQEILIRITGAYERLGGQRAPVTTPAPHGLSRSAPPPTATPRTPPHHPVVGSAPVSLLVQMDNAIGRAQALLEAKQPEAAAELLEHYVHEAGGEQGARLHELLGRAYVELRSWRRAATHLREVIRLEPRNADAHLFLGQTYEGAGFATRAETAYRKALLLRPGHVQALMRLSHVRPPSPPNQRPHGIVSRLFGPRNFGG